MKIYCFCLTFIILCCGLYSCEKCIPVVLCPYVNPYYYSTQGSDTSFIYFPNAFTPNGDGINDIFNVFFSNNIYILNCQIYDANGSQVYQTNSAPFWDGLVNGHTAPVGLYSVKLTAKTTSGASVNLQGTLSLIGGQFFQQDFRNIDGNLYLELKNSRFESQIDFNLKEGYNPNIRNGEDFVTDHVNNCR